MNSARARLAIVACLLLPACKDDSYAVVSVLTDADSIAAVAQLRVHVINDSATDVLYYPQQPTESLALDSVHPVTFSVQFDHSRGGPTTVEVEALDANQATLGYGRGEAVIAQGGVFQVKVVVVAGAVRPERELDGGTTSLACDPYVPAAACGAGQTCGLICKAGEPAVGMCYLAGAGQPGAACAKNDDCVPGTQCFEFSAVGCSVMTCLRFCNHDDNACGETNAFCNLPIPCGSGSTAFLTCSRPCDPTGTGTGGCAAGLACFVYKDETTDCACPGLGAVGAPCTQNQGCKGDEANCAGCAAGSSCVVLTNAGTTAQVCRPICDLRTRACPSGTTCNAFSGSTRGLFGFCQ